MSDILDGMDDSTSWEDPAPDPTVTPDPTSAPTDPSTALAGPTPATPPDAPDGGEPTQVAPPADAAPSEPQPSAQTIKLSTHGEIDASGMTPQQIAAVTRNDEVLRQQQTIANLLREQLKAARQASGQPASPPPAAATAQPSAAPAPTVPSGPTDADVRAAYEAYREDATPDNYFKLQQVQQAKIHAEMKAEFDTELQRALRAQTEALYNSGLLATPELQRLAAQERENSELAQYASRAEQYLGSLVDMGVDVKSLPPTDVGRAYRDLIREAGSYVGPAGETVDLTDPIVHNRILGMAVKDVKESRRAAPQVPPAQPPPAPVAPQGSQQQTKAPLNPLQVPLPKAAPGPMSVPQQGSQASDPWAQYGNIPADLPMSAQLAMIP